jgi:hypothetical protein
VVEEPGRSVSPFGRRRAGGGGGRLGSKGGGWAINVPMGKGSNVIATGGFSARVAEGKGSAVSGPDDGERREGRTGAGVYVTGKVDVVAVGCRRACVVLERKAIVVIVRTTVLKTVNSAVNFSITFVFSEVEVPIPEQVRELDFDIVDSEGSRVKIVSLPDIVRLSRARRTSFKARMLYITCKSTDTM